LSDELPGMKIAILAADEDAHRVHDEGAAA
jgi:hypothetical protein